MKLPNVPSAVFFVPNYFHWPFAQDYDNYYLFFFSSRRRHTRLQGDWSSDVCSSDLLALLSVDDDGLGRVARLRPRDVLLQQRDRKEDVVLGGRLRGGAARKDGKRGCGECSPDERPGNIQTAGYPRPKRNSAQLRLIRR